MNNNPIFQTLMMLKTENFLEVTPVFVAARLSAASLQICIYCVMLGWAGDAAQFWPAFPPLCCQICCSPQVYKHKLEVLLCSCVSSSTAPRSWGEELKCWCCYLSWHCPPGLPGALEPFMWILDAKLLTTCRTYFCQKNDGEPQCVMERNCTEITEFENISNYLGRGWLLICSCTGMKP